MDEEGRTKGKAAIDVVRCGRCAAPRRRGCGGLRALGALWARCWALACHCAAAASARPLRPRRPLTAPAAPRRPRPRLPQVGAQTGKSAGSVLQQALLIFSAGSIHNILPVMCVVFLAMCNGWLRSVDTLADHHDFSKHFSMPATVTSSLDEEAGGEAGGPGGAQQAVPVQAQAA